MNKVCLIIPARLDSKRFPNKLLSKLLDKYLIQHVMEAVNEIASVLVDKRVCVDKFLAIDVNSANADQISIIKNMCKDLNIKFFPMSDEVFCGTERVKYIKNAHPKFDYYITIPSDEPSISGTEVGKSILKILNFNNKRTIYTLNCPFYSEEDLMDYRSCKLVVDKYNNILYTSRSVIPGNKTGKLHNLGVYKRHLGVFVFPKKVLKRNIWKPRNYSYFESLEQNMYIRQRFKFKTMLTKHIGFGIDTPDQLKKLEERLIEDKQ